MAGAKKPLFPASSPVVLPAVFAPIVSRPMLDDFSLRAARQAAKAAPAGLSISQDLPLRSHPMWSGNNEIGNEVPFAPDANNRQMILKMGEWGPPKVWTGALGIIHSDITGSATRALAIQAELQFGSGGIIQEAVIDWLEGTTFTMPFNSIVVTAVYAASPVGLPTDIRLRATVGVGEKERGRPPIFSIQVPSMVTGGGTVQSDIFRVPAFAKSVMVVDRSTSNGSVYSTNFSLRFHPNNDPAMIKAIEVTGDTLLQFAGSDYPLSRFCNYFSLEARNPLVAVQPTVIFDIDI